MPKVPMDYSKTHFYKIVCNDLSITNCYVGHTLNLTKRRNSHKSSCCNEDTKLYNKYLYTFIRENGGWQNWQMVLIDTHSFENREGALKKEREYIEKYNANLNQYLPIISKDEIKTRKSQYREDNKEYLLEKKNIYYEENKDDIKEKKKQYYLTNKQLLNEKNKLYRQQHKEHLKTLRLQHYDENNDKILEKKKVYYEQNRDYILERHKQKVGCPCGSVVCKSDIRKHERSNKHQDYMKFLQN